MKAASLFALALSLFASACARRENTLKDIVTQTAARGVRTATACSNLFERGNFGVGTMADGDFILENAKVYRVAGDGHVRPAPADAVASFAVVTPFETDRSYDVGGMDFKIFKNTMDWKRASPARIYAIRINGAFSRVRIGDKPELHDVRGSLQGFFYPEYLGGLNEPGYELYYLNADRTEGGRVTDFTIRQGRIELDECSALRLDLPEKL